MKKGFTLIELLAVILILGIIALIAVPAVSNIVEEAKKGATEQSVNQFINAIDKQIAINQMNSDPTDDINDGTYNIPLDSKYRIKLKGQTPTDGWVKIEDGNVSEYSLVIGDYTVSYDGTNKTIVEGNNQSLIVYRYSSDELFVGDKIDLENRKVTSYKKINYDEDSDDGNFEIVDVNETRPMTGVYSTNISDVLTVSVDPYGNATDNTNPPFYLKHIIDGNGIITKTEVCNINSWGTLCREQTSTYNNETGKFDNPEYEIQINELFDFYKYNPKTDTSQYNNVDCFGDSSEVNVFCIERGIDMCETCILDDGSVMAMGGTIGCASLHGFSACGTVTRY